MDKSDFEALKTKALLRIYYFDLYYKFDQQVRKIFEESIADLEPKIINKLYFYLGSNHMLKFGVEYEGDKANATHKVFTEKEKFKDFPLAKIIKINKKDNFLKPLDFTMPMINRSSIALSFSEIAVKLVNMRNLLAHDKIDYNYTEKEHVIETLSLEKLQELNSFDLDSYSLNHSDEQNLKILSNLIYMQNLNNRLGC